MIYAFYSKYNHVLQKCEVIDFLGHYPSLESAKKEHEGTYVFYYDSKAKEYYDLLFCMDYKMLKEAIDQYVRA